jgi:ribosome-binding protein aMBF1 (putative translation factor)
MGHQTITSPSGDELVILPRAEYDNLVRLAAEAEEDAADVAIYDARKADASPALPAAVTMAMLRGDSRLKALRTWKDVGQVKLADEIGTSQGFISDLESGRRGLTEDVRKRIAKALDVPEAWL